jgi:transcription elongation GreA/GreB family factor
MSVAFRRESDEEHLEPKFELPIPPGPNLVTARGLALIGERLAALEAAIAAAPDEAARAPLQRDVRYWSARRQSAVLAPVPAGDRVEFGTRVTFVLKGAERTFLLVGDDEADPAAGLLSFNAPLARAMLGAEPGEFVAFAGEEDAIEVISISAPSPLMGGSEAGQRPTIAQLARAAS